MQVITWNQFLEKGLPLKNKSASFTVGVFDGVHRGHQALLKKIVSHNVDFVPVVVTFKENHKIGSGERGAGSGERAAGEIFSFEKRLKMFEKLGIGITIVINFDDEFKKMPGENFIEILYKHGNIGYFAAGEDFRCGYQLDTDAEIIKKIFLSHGVPVEIVPQVMEDSIPVSSSRIRKAIASGDIQAAEKMLGWKFNSL